MKQLSTLIALSALLVLAASPAAAVVTTITNIQTGSHSIGDEVTVENVVVTASGFWGFFVQELDPQTWPDRMYSGIFIHTAASHIGDIKRGDLVNVTGVYDEYYDFSEIDLAHDYCGVTAVCFYEIIGTADVPEPVELLISEVNDTGPLNEAYESVLIRVDREDQTLFAGQPNQYDDWYLFTDAVGVGDSLLVELRSADPGGDFSYPLPEEGDELEFLQGIHTYSYGHYKLAPRNCPEDMGMPCPPVLQSMCAYANFHIDVIFAVDVDSVSASNTFFYDMDSGLEILAAERQPENHKLVRLTTEEQTPGYIETGYVEGVLSEGDLIPAPPGEYTFAQGILPIYDIQYVEDLVEDASEYENQVVTTTGRITAIEDDKYYYLQQGDAGPFKHLYVRRGKIGDLALGDSVKVAGKVVEYYGWTELKYATNVQLYENLGPAIDPIVRNDLFFEQMLYDAAAGDNNPPDDNLPEPWESAYIRLSNCAIIDSVEGSAALWGDWWALNEASVSDTCLFDFSEDLNGDGALISYEPQVDDMLMLSGILQCSFGYRLVPRFEDDIRICDSSVEYRPIEAARATLRQNSPNPFGPATTIAFHLEGPAQAVEIEIFDVTGAKVRGLLNGAPFRAGPHKASWNGTDDQGQPMASGKYFYRLTVDGRSEAKQMILLK